MTAFASRRVFAAAHVVADPAADNAPGAAAALDWDATLAFRHHLWSLGLGVADAMDTAQRGMGLDWPATSELIRRSGAEAASVGGRLCCGVGTDQLTAAAEQRSLAEIGDAYEAQLEVVEQAGAQPVLMCSRALAAAARGPEDYATVYSRVLGQSGRPAILHWLGDMFDPALRGYWGSADLDTATETVLALIREHAPRIDGIKVSLLDADREIALRRALPEGVRLYTGDDFNFPELIAGDEYGYSDALLGVFDPLAVQAAEALGRLDAGDAAGFRAVLDPLVPLARHIFAAPTQYYKTGVVFLAYLSGHQEHFRMLGGQETGRDRTHLGTLYRMALDAGILPDPELAAARFAAAGLSTAPTDRLSLNVWTTKNWTLAQAVAGCVEQGVPGIGLWRDKVAEHGLPDAAELLRASGLVVTSLCRGGFFTAPEVPGTDPAADNRDAVDECVALGTDVLVLVAGGLPAGSKDLRAARRSVALGIAGLAPYAAERGVKLAIEPLHPMFCADRAVVSTLGQALDLAEQAEAATGCRNVGVCVDTYHVWWDPQVFEQIRRAGRAGRIFAFQVCDFLVPIPARPLLGRGHVGDGVAEIAELARAVRAAGYTGFTEVEIFNQQVWDTPGEQTLRTVIDRHARLLAELG